MIFTVIGENDFARSAELEGLAAGFIAKYGDMGLERLDSEEVEFQRIYDALTSLPFLVTRRMIILRNPGANKEFSEKAEQLLGSLPESTDVILTGRKLDKRSSLYKLLKKITDFREFNELDVTNLAQWLSEQAKTKNGSLSVTDARFLIERLGTNQQLLQNELTKLLLYNPKVTHESIVLLSEPMPQSTIFELLDALFAGNLIRASMLYGEQRALKVEPQQIIAMLTWQLQILALLKTAGERNPDQIAKEAKANPYVIRKSLVIVRHLSLVKLKELINNLLILDIRLKTESIDADETLQYFLLNLSMG
ncbi:MAG TPA: DNA polymerase III subunit delta [Candidatus Saccharimonadales bacterium]|nr:DNA polymerase III subunit delta [Candidatus Saccharimonadales bacterium]